MPLRVVGAGLGRTGTRSLKAALEHLLGGEVHHMSDVFANPARQVPYWQSAVEGASYETWGPALGGFVASVDWPSCRWYRTLAAENPDAIVLLSHREDADTWWRSAERTIFMRIDEDDGPLADVFRRMVRPLIRDHIGSYTDESVAKAGYERHNAQVRRDIPPERLVEWMPADGWGPLCHALGVPVPAEPFPVLNTTNEYRARHGLDHA
jgi:hypothetical protein